MNKLPLFPVTTVGSWPRPKEILQAQREKQAGRLSEAEFDRMADRAVAEVVRIQEEAGMDIITDGEQRRDNFFSFVAEKLAGVRMMTLAQMLDVVEDKAGFEEILQTLDVPAFSIRNATAVGRIERKKALAVDELKALRRCTGKPVKIPLPGPYLLTRAMFVPSLTSPAYPTKEDLAKDVVRVLQEEIGELIEAGADFVQLDEPVLTELVFTQGKTRTFMCAALAARKDPAEELEFAVELINQVVDGARKHAQKAGADGGLPEKPRDVRIGLHVCRGNWSTDESTLLRGNYQPLAPYLSRLHVDQLVLEYATERAGDLMGFGNHELGLGVVNPRTAKVETVEDILHFVDRALQIYRPDQLFLNPDCGFSTFSARPVNVNEVASRKIRVMAEAADVLRGRMS